jgi:hypothetical protein
MNLNKNLENAPIQLLATGANNYLNKNVGKRLYEARHHSNP